jgi:hypothetical protein
MLTYAGIGDLDERELFDLENAFNTSTSKWQVKAIGDVIGARALIGWTTDGHTGMRDKYFIVYDRIHIE